MRRVVTLAMALALILGFAGAGMAAEKAKIVTIPVAFMQESPAFNVWYAHKVGWDKQEGLDFKILTFDSGPAQMEALPAKQWVLCSTGVGGQLIGGMRYKVVIVAPELTEAGVNALYVRPNSPILKHKGVNPKYPDIYGSADTVKGKNILLTSATTVHYVTGNWLKILGLTTKDVTLTNMDQSSIIPAFEQGIGDVAALWAPFTFTAEAHGWVQIGNTGNTKAFTASMLVGDKDWCNKHPELVAKFLRVIFRVNNYITENRQKPAFKAEYVKFLDDFCGMKMNEKAAMQDLDIHPRWTLQEAIKLSTPGANGRSEIAQWLDNAADFFQSVGSYSPAEVKHFKDQKLVTDKYLKMAAKTPLLPAK